MTSERTNERTFIDADCSDISAYIYIYFRGSWGGCVGRGDCHELLAVCLAIRILRFVVFCFSAAAVCDHAARKRDFPRDFHRYAPGFAGFVRFAIRSMFRAVWHYANELFAGRFIDPPMMHVFIETGDGKCNLQQVLTADCDIYLSLSLLCGPVQCTGSAI